MKTKKTIIIILVIFIILFLCSCITLGTLFFILYNKSSEKEDNANQDTSNSENSMAKFESSSEFDEYVEKISENFEEIEESNEYGASEDTYPMQAGEGKDDGTDSESITNIQEKGVDEGDIVKAYKDYLVILRRGRIFTVKVTSEENDILETVSVLNAYPKNFTQGTWYDEMLIYGNTIVVVGYSYEMNATEVGLFNIDDEGSITHKSTYFIDSNDYYSSRNYTSRLVDNNLIFYMPYYLFTWDYSEDEEYYRKTSLPEIKKWIKDNETTEGEDILDKTDIYKPIQDTLYPTLHTVVTCDLSSSNLDCNAQAILGPYSRNFYVSNNAIYIWTSEDPYEYYYSDESDTDKDKTYSYLYRIPLKENSALVLQADGAPIDQFSFKEDSDGYLNVFVRENTAGEGMWNSEVTSGGVALMRVSINEFSNTPRLISRNSFTILTEPEGYTIQNRYVGDYLLYGSGSNWYYDESADNYIYIKNYKTDENIQTLELNHSIDRIDVMGDGAVVVGNNDEDLKFSSLELSGKSKITDVYIVENAVQGELRSHGFFYKDDISTLGLPIRKENESYEHLFNESAEILFLNVNNNREFINMGSLEADPPREENDNCEFSCVDWYGNSRPIFYNDRIFALMGYEIVEGKITNNVINELNRVNYFSE